MWTVFALALSASAVTGLELAAHFSQHGVSGTVTFHQGTGQEGDEAEGKVVLTARLSVAEEYAGEYSWGVYEFPVDHREADPCHSRWLGRSPVVNLDEVLGRLQLPPPPAEEGGSSDGVIATYTDALELGGTGKNGLWGRSLVLEGPSKTRVCATIMPKEEEATKVSEARFASPVAGSVWFMSVDRRAEGAGVETRVLSDMFHVRGKSKSSTHAWRLFITDVFEATSDLSGSGCEFLQVVYDPENTGGVGCSEDAPEKCRGGDLVGKFGEVRVGQKKSMFTRGYFVDGNLPLPELGHGRRSLYLVIYDDENPQDFLACARVRDIQPKEAKATFSAEGISGTVSFTQISPFFPTVTGIDLRGLNGGAGGFHVHEFAVPAKRDVDDNPCKGTAGHYNPHRVDASLSPSPGSGTFDKYEVGDLSGKYGSLEGKNNVIGRFVDPTISLWGIYSIERRSVVIHRTPVPKRWTCASITTGRREVTAIAEFVYPMAGRIVMTQEENDPFADTTVFVESLLYSDGTKNYTRNHRWAVHDDMPGRDYYNWTGRCLSAGDTFNPYQVKWKEYLSVM
jgi:Cu/Zn superoxide dismutase